MKNILLFIMLYVFTLTACSDWLNVKPVEQVDADEMFGDERGFLQTLNGSYLILSSPELYGRELTVGFPDEIVRYWNKMTEFYDFNYTEETVENTLATTWSSLYRAIANTNLLLNNLAIADSVHFLYYDLIRGEALGLRAYAHLDLLRLFGPVLNDGLEQPSIPYRDEFSKNLVQRMPVNEVMDKIERDLQEAYVLLQNDPIKEYGRKNTSIENVDNLAFDFRGVRMNYYAVCATLSRLYLLRGDKENALRYAEEVINAKDIFQLVQREDVVADPVDMMFEREVVWTLYDQNSETNLSNRFVQGTYLFDEDLWLHVYENANSYGAADDYRATNWDTRIISGPHTLAKYIRHTSNTGDDDSPWALGVPMIRLTEMYYIAAECYLETNPSESYRLLNEVRASRNLLPLPESLQNNVDVLLDQIVYESRKDFWGEGKMFFLYKRLFRDIELPTNSIPANENLFELPIPQDELEYGGN